MRRWFPLTLLSILGLAACGDSLITPREGQPRQVSVLLGGGQQAPVGSALADSVVVRITDGVGRAVVRLPISVNIPSGGGISPAGLQTDDDGRAAFRWTLGPSAGVQTIEVTAGDTGHVAPKAVISATATAGNASTLTVLQGDQQTGEVGQPLTDSLVVEVRDGFANPLAGVSLTWSPGAGSVNPVQLVSDANGRAAGAWTLGASPGTQTATLAVTADAAVSASFTADATPGPAPILAIATQPSDTVQSGAPFTIQPTIQLQDAGGSPLAVAGVSIAVAVASGGAVLGGTTSRQTDATGLATFTDLSLSGPSGPSTLIFAASGYVSITSDPVLVGRRVPSATNSTVAVAPGSITAGASASIHVTVRDSSGSPIPGVLVVLSASGTGNTLVQSPSRTDGAGSATGSLSSTVAETKQISATADGIVLASTGLVVVSPGPPDASTTTAKVPGAVRPLRVVSIVITTRDGYGNALATGGFGGQFAVVVTGGNAGNKSVVDNGDGTYSTSYLALFTGTDTVAITLGGQPIQGSPWSIKIK